MGARFSLRFCLRSPTWLNSTIPPPKFTPLAPSPPSAIAAADTRRVLLLKSSGYNSVRTAHNPPSRSFLDACDTLGIIVMEEAFDCWTEGKKRDDYHLYFREWWRRDVAAMVLRDRNRPSVLFWSIGNEIPERYTPEGAELAREIAEWVREIDAGGDGREGGKCNGGGGSGGGGSGECSDSGCGGCSGASDADTARGCDCRPPQGSAAYGAAPLRFPLRLVTAAFPGPTAAPAPDLFLASLDVAGYNYAPDAFERDHKRDPQVGGCGELGGEWHGRAGAVSRVGEAMKEDRCREEG
jgi:hypothetical protein